MQNLFISNAAKTLSIQKQAVWWCRTRKIYSFSFTAEGSDLTIKYVCLIRMAMSTERASRVVTFDPLNPGFIHLKGHPLGLTTTASMIYTL